MTCELGLGIGMCLLNPPKPSVKEFYCDRSVLLQFRTSFFMLHLQLQDQITELGSVFSLALIITYMTFLFTNTENT